MAAHDPARPNLSRASPTRESAVGDASVREDLAAAVAARRELGPDYETAVVDGFLDRMDAAIAARVDSRVAERLEQPRGKDDAGNSQFVLALGSLGLAIPLSAIAGGIGDLPGLIVAWAGIVGVNGAHALRWRRR